MKAGSLAILAVSTLMCLMVQGQNSSRPLMKPVDPGVADMGPLSGPGRALSPGLRQPSGFDRVYEVEIDGKKYFARQNGSTVAVFPRSAYSKIEGRTATLVPAGTVFYLGGLPDNARPISPEEMSANYAGLPQNLAVPVNQQSTRVDLSAAAISARGQARSQPVTIDVPASNGNVWESESYRVLRTSQLIDAALIAKRNRAS
ncbi:MAG: hypothetical protein JNK16_03385 [Phycisphaerales bacterium]|nr:hypothetical protein [Phycisphaerales bacterium]